ncbi:MAG: hypothetical protein LBJ00_08040 [Planctomycetaceae bacterium]|jgi:hypothetical protein|nr:hypothetical protein [Planctomycetaceae bacterium]
MKLRKFWKYAATTAVLFTTLPVCTFAQSPSVTVSNEVTNAEAGFIVPGPTSFLAGVEISATGANAGSVRWDNGGNVVPYTENYIGGIGTIKMQGVNIPNVNSGVGTNFLGVLVNGDGSLSNKTIDVGNINLAGNTGLAMSGFYTYRDTAFDGTLKIGNVSVTNNNNAATVWATGVNFVDKANITIDISGKVTVGNINVKGFDVVGFRAKDIVGGAEVTLGDIDVTAGTGTGAWWSCGVGVSDIVDGKLSIGNVNVTSTSNNDVSGVGLRGIMANGSLAIKILLSHVTHE